MRALRRSISTTPYVSSQYPRLRAFFGLGQRRDASQTAQGLGSATSASRPPSLTSALPESTHSGPPSGSECAICRSESANGEMTLKVPTEACTHPRQVCVGCLQQVILAAIVSGDFITGIMCPSYGCPQRLGYHDVQKSATQEVFDRYDKLLTRESLRIHGSYVFCVKPSCTAGQEHTGEINNIVTCPQCGTKQCFRHGTPWHEGLTCEQWDEQQRTITRQQEQKTEAWIQTGTKPCPGPGCGRRIQKSDGCDHMTCKRPGGCGHQFCWECLAPWLQIISTDNSKHYDNCRYYSGRPGKNPPPPEVVAARTVCVPPADSSVANPALSNPRRLCELPSPHAAQQRESGRRTPEIPIQALFPPVTPNAPPADPFTNPNGSSHLSIQAKYGRKNQGSLLRISPEVPPPTPRGPIAGPSTNQGPPAAMQPTLGDWYDLHSMSVFTGNFCEDEATQRRRKNAVVQKLHRERKKAYQAGPSRVQSLQGRINILEAQHTYECEQQNLVSWPPSQSWPDPGYQLPPYSQTRPKLLL